MACIIYGLFDPRDPIELDNCRYVGQTIQTLPERLRGHVFGGKNGSSTGTRSYCNNWVKSLLTAGVKPVIRLIELATPETLDALEIFWIAEGKRRGWRLVNDPSKLGGNSVDAALVAKMWKNWYDNNPDEVAAMRAKQRAWWDDPANHEAASQRRKAHWADPWKREKHLASMNTPEYRQVRSDIMTRRWSDPDKREEMLGRLIEMLQNEDKTDTPCPHNDCSFVATGPRGLAIHLAHSHTEQIETYCDCGAGPFAAKRHLTQHITKLHIIDKTPLACECGAGPFKDQSGLRIHQANHDKTIEPTLCECGAGPFASIQAFTTHARRSPQHQDKQMTYCDICDGGPFKDKQGLGLHKRHKHSV